MSFTLENFVRSILAVDAAVGDTSLVVALAAPPLRDPPAASAGAPGILILQDQPTAPTKIEIVTYTGVAIAGTRVTLSGVTRGLEGTTAQAWTAGTSTFSGSTAAVLAGFALKTALAMVATSGSYADLTGVPTTWDWSNINNAPVQTTRWPAWSEVTAKPAFGTAAFTPIGNYATAAQGVKADSAVQPPALAPYAPINHPNFDTNVAAGYDVADTSAARAQSVQLQGAGGVGAGGTLTFGVGFINFAFIKGYFTDGVSNGAGKLVFGTRTSVSDPTITGKMILHENGSLGLVGDISAPNIGRAAAGSSRIFVQSADPGAAAADGDIWLW